LSHPNNETNCNFEKMKNYTTLVFGLILMTLVSCKHEPPPDLDGTLSENCDPDTVYFGNTILPLLASNCGMSGCHDEASHKDGIIVTDYYSLMNSDIIDIGNANNSDLIEAITENDPDDIMPPPPSAPLTTEQINAIRTWINQGAKFNNCVGCDTLNYTFNAYILPIIQTNCSGCHSGGSPDANLVLTNYAEISSIANNGSLMHSLNGTGGYSIMPKNTSGLQSCKITQIQKWINDGAPNN
jgi:mono/diheme cytochrome c family protein